MAKKGERKNVRVGKLIHEEEHIEGTHDFTPWVEMKSSRLKRARFDRATGAIQIDWGNGNPGYVYRDVGYETWRGFIRASSKGRYVNNSLGNNYRPLDSDELNIPSNTSRSNPLGRGKNLA